MCQAVISRKVQKTWWSILMILFTLSAPAKGEEVIQLDDVCVHLKSEVF